MTHLADLQPEHRSVGQFSMASGRTYVSRSKGKVAATSLADLKLGLQSSRSRMQPRRSVCSSSMWLSSTSGFSASGESALQIWGCANKQSSLPAVHY